VLNGLDLFSGIGGLSLALAPWVKPVAYCETERYAQAVLLSLMCNGKLPLAPIWDDVRTLRGDMLPGVDILYGGFPCQDLSVAGNGAGLGGERSGLFFEVARLVGEIRPRFLFLENVPAIRSRGADVVCGRLAELGYDCRWGVLSAFDVGAPHLRERWWLLAHGHGHGHGLEVESQRHGEEPSGGRSQRSDADRLRDSVSDTFRNELRDQQRWWLGESRSSQARLGADGETQPLADADNSRSGTVARVPGWQDSEPFRGDWWAVEPDVGRVASGVSFRVDRLRGLGNAVCPPTAREAFKRLMGLT
jgi:DNA (cytosine-5)-methyltransferase 1